MFGWVLQQCLPSRERERERERYILIDFNLKDTIDLCIRLQVGGFFLLTVDFCRLLLTFADSLDPGQGRHSFGKPFDTLIMFQKYFLGKS